MRMHSAQRRERQLVTPIARATLLLKRGRLLSSFFMTSSREIEAVCPRLSMADGPSAQKRSKAAMDPASRQHQLVGLSPPRSQHSTTRDCMDSTEETQMSVSGTEAAQSDGTCWLGNSKDHREGCRAH